MSKFKEDFGIRALFGVLIIVGFILSVSFAMFKRPDVLGTIKDIYVPIVITIIAFYFGQKSVTK